MKKYNLLDMAEQQILGFYHASRGETLESLISSMGLTKEEYIEMHKKGMLNYLTNELKEEIDNFFGITL
jgi:hypothetical protein